MPNSDTVGDVASRKDGHLTAATGQPIETSAIAEPIPTRNVFIPFLLLMLMLGATPAILFNDGPVERGIAAAAAALAVALVGAFMRPREGSHLAGLVRPWAPVVAVPALWMVIQALPMPLSSLAHPIWASAAAALNVPLTGAISIDPGMTLIGFGRYLFAVGIAFVATAVAIDRRRAEWTLFALAGMTAALSALLIVADFGGLALPGADRGAAASLHAISALGAIISSAAALHAVERFETLRDRTAPATARSAAVIGACIFAGAVCGFAVIYSSPGQIVFVSACGLAVLALIVAARRLGIGRRSAMAMAAAGLVAASAVVLSGPDGHGDPFIRFAIAGPTSAIERMMADTAMAGSGAGTISALLPIYGTADDISANAAAPTAAAATAIELGRPMWAVVLLIAIAIAGALFRSAMLRGRDSSCPAAAASCVVAMVLESFVDATLFDTAVMLVASAAIGLGLAQSVSRTVQ